MFTPHASQQAPPFSDMLGPFLEINGKGVPLKGDFRFESEELIFFTISADSVGAELDVPPDVPLRHTPYLTISVLILGP
jgi:hypothetical protein